MGIKGLGQCIHVDLEDIFRRVLTNTLELAFIATGQASLDVLVFCFVKAHGKHGILELSQPDIIQGCHIFGPRCIFTAYPHFVLAVKIQTIKVVVDHRQHPFKAGFEATLKAVENGIPGFQFAFTKLIVEVTSVFLEFVDIRLNQVQPIRVEIL